MSAGTTIAGYQVLEEMGIEAYLKPLQKAQKEIAVMRAVVEKSGERNAQQHVDRVQGELGSLVSGVKSMLDKFLPDKDEVTRYLQERGTTLERTHALLKEMDTTCESLTGAESQMASEFQKPLNRCFIPSHEDREAEAAGKAFSNPAAIRAHFLEEVEKVAASYKKPCISLPFMPGSKARNLSVTADNIGPIVAKYFKEGEIKPAALAHNLQKNGVPPIPDNERGMRR